MIFNQKFRFAFLAVVAYVATFGAVILYLFFISGWPRFVLYFLIFFGGFFGFIYSFKKINKNRILIVLIPSLLCLQFSVVYAFSDFYLNGAAFVEYKIRMNSFEYDVFMAKKSEKDFKSLHWITWAGNKYNPWFIYDENVLVADGWTKYEGCLGYLHKLEDSFYFFTNSCY